MSKSHPVENNGTARKNAEPTDYGITHYGAALELYRTTDMSVKEICEQTGTSVSAFRSYLRRCHRELMFARYGIAVSPEEAAKARLRKKSGQTAAGPAKYKDAIEACDNIAYIEYNISQIARMFGLDPTALGKQLRHHYPEIQERREKERHCLGLNDNLHRGMKPYCKEQYADAVEHLRTTDDTIRQTADLYHISQSGLREHLLYYNKELTRKRARKREHAKTNKVKGGLTGRGGKYEPTPQSVEKYREAIHLYRTTAMTQEEICHATGVSLTGLRHHLQMWNKELVQEHYNVDGGKEPDRPLVQKRYLKSTAAKYAEAIRRLKESGLPTAEVAKAFGLHPETFRDYLYEHEPQLAATLGMTRLANGKLVLVRSAEKYAEAVSLYETTPETLKSIALRLGLQYNSLSSFIRRNRPDAMEAHNRLLGQEEILRKQKEGQESEKLQAESARLTQEKEAEEKERILQALKQTGGHKRNAAKLLGIGKSTLYNKMKAFGLLSGEITI